jgi:hypothetical protein
MLTPDDIIEIPTEKLVELISRPTTISTASESCLMTLLTELTAISQVDTMVCLFG